MAEQVVGREGGEEIGAIFLRARACASEKGVEAPVGGFPHQKDAIFHPFVLIKGAAAFFSGASASASLFSQL